MNFVVLDAFAADHLGHLDEAMGRAIEADYRVPTLHVTLKTIELLATLHNRSLRLARLRVRVLQHIIVEALTHLFSVQGCGGVTVVPAYESSNGVHRPVQFSRLSSC